MLFCYPKKLVLSYVIIMQHQMNNYVKLKTVLYYQIIKQRKIYNLI